MTAARWTAIGGIVGPVVFIATWATCGSVTDGSSPVDDAISDLAAVHASTRIAMTTAFVVFGLAMCCYAYALRAALPGLAWAAAAISGVATLGVAAFPLDHSSTVDRLHGLSAGLGYVTLALTALLSVAPLRPSGWARLALGLGILSAIALGLTLAGAAHGFFQRLGLTAGDIWVVVSSVAILGSMWNTSR